MPVSRLPISRLDVELAVVRLLEPLEISHRCLVRPWPDRDVNGASMDRMVLVALAEERWDPLLSFDGDQAGVLVFDLQLVGRERRGDFGLLALRDAIDSLMAGDVAGLGPCELQRCDFLGREQSVWRFGLKYLLRVNRFDLGG